MKIQNQYLDCDIISHNYSSPTLNSIGYDNYNAAICIPKTFFISSHAPSELKIVFKNNNKFYINGMLNKNTGIKNDSIIFNIKQNNINLLNFKESLEYYSFYPIKNQEYVFKIDCNQNQGAHTIWNFWNCDEDLSEIENKALDRANKINLDKNSDYSLFIQTCNPRKKMAFRCVVSFLNQVCRMPKNIIICSLDNINDNSINFPSCVEFWTGKQLLTNKLVESGISLEAIEHIFNGFKTAGNPNMWLKYVIPRLCLNKQKVLILDDDIAFLGPCKELIDSDSYLTFMEDNASFYGRKTIEWYNKNHQKNYEIKSPFVCAGMCKIDCSKFEYDPKFIDGMIKYSESDPDEQCAVGMELILNPDFTSLSSPKYHHGGFVNQNVDLNNLELIHMQGRAVGWRTNKDFIEYFMSK